MWCLPKTHQGDGQLCSMSAWYSTQVTWHQVMAQMCREVVEINSSCVHICKLSLGTLPNRVIAASSSSVPENSGFNSSSGCYGNNSQVLCVFRAPPLHPRGYVGSPTQAAYFSCKSKAMKSSHGLTFSLCFSSSFALSVGFFLDQGRMQSWHLWLGTD